MAAEMASLQALQSFNGIPIRMQYWAAGEKWGDSIRNPELHSPLIKQMKIWSNWCNPTSPTTYFSIMRVNPQPRPPRLVGNFHSK